MDTIAVRRYNMLVRVREFGTAHPDLFPADSLGARTLAELGDIVDRLGASVMSESSGRSAARQGTVSKTSARQALRVALETIARTARGIAVDTPGVAGGFLVPDGKNDHELAIAARRFAEDAAPLSASFIAHGLPASFVADLQATLALFERATSGRATAREAHVGARAGINAGIDAAFAILPRLDAIVENRVAGEPSLLATWRSARHVEARSGRTEAAAPEAPATAAEPAGPIGAPAASATSVAPAA
jgi:hypothetical protein